MSNDILLQLSAMRRFFETGATKTYQFRKQQLLALKQAVVANEEEIYTALYTDLKKARKNVGLRKMVFFWLS